MRVIGRRFPIKEILGQPDQLVLQAQLDPQDHPVQPDLLDLLVLLARLVQMGQTEQLVLLDLLDLPEQLDQLVQQVLPDPLVLLVVLVQQAQLDHKETLVEHLSNMTLAPLLLKQTPVQAN
jgi:hypothetical protein